MQTGRRPLSVGLTNPEQYNADFPTSWGGRVENQDKMHSDEFLLFVEVSDITRWIHGTRMQGRKR